MHCIFTNHIILDFSLTIYTYKNLCIWDFIVISMLNHGTFFTKKQPNWLSNLKKKSICKEHLLRCLIFSLKNWFWFMRLIFILRHDCNASPVRLFNEYLIIFLEKMKSINFYLALPLFFKSNSLNTEQNFYNFNQINYLFIPF